MTTVNHLPGELVSLILQNILCQRDLYYCALVNNAFYTETRRLLWRSPNLSLYHAATHFFDSLATASLSVGHHIRTIMLEDDDFECSDEHLLLLMKKASLLEHLHIGDGYLIKDTSFQYLPFYCRHLTTLFLFNSAITQRSFDSLGRHCHQLRRLALIACKGVPGNLFLALKDCPLEEIKLDNFDDDAIWNALETGIVDLTRFHRLTCLVIKESPIRFIRQLLLTATTTTTTAAAAAAATLVDNPLVAWPQLSHLVLDGCAALGDNDGLVGFFNTHPQLTSISLSSATITDHVLDGIAASLPKVSYVNVSYNYYLSHHGVRRLVEHCPALTKIDLVNCGLCWYNFPEALGSNPPYYVEKLNVTAINKIHKGRPAGEYHYGDNDDDDDDDDNNDDDTDSACWWQWH
ncbi:hypothetical protein BCR42DRAFT_421101, partial [Absidia repens]